MGLYLVCALAARTGESGDAYGRTVWAEVPWECRACATGLCDSPARRPHHGEVGWCQP